MPKVTAKKKCCEDKPRCSNCPEVLTRLTKMGYAKKDGGTDYKVSAKIPKKARMVARAR